MLCKCAVLHRVLCALRWCSEPTISRSDRQLPCCGSCIGCSCNSCCTIMCITAAVEVLLCTGSQIGNITCDTLVVRRADNKAIFAFVLDAFGLNATELAKLNRQIVELGNPVKRSAVRTGKGRMVVTGFRLCRHDGTLDRYLLSMTVCALPLASSYDLQLV